MTKLELRTYFAAYELRIITLEQDFLELRYNHNHDDKGRFCSGGGGGNSLDKSEKSGIIKAEIEEKFKKYVPNREERKEIIKKGISVEKPIFDNGSLAKYYQYTEKENGYYDVVMHGKSDAVSFYGKLIDYQTLGAIIVGRSDYQKGTPIRLFSCSTGKGENSFAENLSKMLGVEVKAPNQDIHISLPINGKSKYYIQSGKGKRDGDWVVFGGGSGKK